VQLLDIGFRSGTAAQYWGAEPDEYSPTGAEEFDNATEASDIYGVAATLWYLATGSRPPSAAERLEAVTNDAPDPLSELIHQPGQVPAELLTILAGAMSLEPSSRPQTASRFRAALRQSDVARSPRSSTAARPSGTGSINPTQPPVFESESQMGGDADQSVSANRDSTIKAMGVDDQKQESQPNSAKGGSTAQGPSSGRPAASPWPTAGHGHSQARDGSSVGDDRPGLGATFAGIIFGLLLSAACLWFWEWLRAS